MHEMSLAEGMLQIVEDTAKGNAASRVTAIWLEIGTLAQVERDALRFCFDAVTRGGIAEGARLEIIDTPGAAWCIRCAGRVALAALGDACPQCGSYQLQVVAGNDMRIKEIAIE
ncbi:MAG: hydrogenase maturation nickel metallochaperone HypA [Betaproteobacteria bacterium]|nr:hydrogenase maturation nickel metallochaperone HypA [Betaproteobacteria bacterium]